MVLGYDGNYYSSSAEGCGQCYEDNDLFDNRHTDNDLFDEQRTTMSSSAPKKNVLFSLLFVSMIGAIAFIPSVWTLFGIAALLVFAFVASNKNTTKIKATSGT